jgi:hypothetical protein
MENFRVLPKGAVPPVETTRAWMKSELARLAASQQAQANAVPDQMPEPAAQAPGPMSPAVAHVRPVAGPQQFRQAKELSRKYLDEL